MTIAHPPTALLTLLICASLGLSCDKPKTEENQLADSRSASLDAPGRKTLKKELKTWKQRWAREKVPAGCEEVLSEASQLEDCKRTAKLLVSVKQVAKRMESTPSALEQIGDLALAATNAEQSLRQAAIEGFASRGTPEAKGDAVGPANVPPSPQGRGTGAAGTQGTNVGAAANVLPRRTRSRVLRAYSNLARQALRYLSVFLELGSPPLRSAALAELERLAPKRDRWRALARVVRQASLTESDPKLRERLSALEKRLTPPTLRAISEEEERHPWPRPSSD